MKGITEKIGKEEIRVITEMARFGIAYEDRREAIEMRRQLNVAEKQGNAQEYMSILWLTPGAWYKERTFPEAG